MQLPTFFPERMGTISCGLTMEGLQQKLESGDIVVGKVVAIEQNRVKIWINNNITGFIPADEITITKSPKDGIMAYEAKYLLDKSVFVKVLYIGNEVLFSRAKSMSVVKEYLLANIGINVTGFVTRVDEKSAFLDLGHGVVGKLNIRDTTVARRRSMSELFQKGDIITVNIKEYSGDYNSFIVSYKDACENYEDASQVYIPGNVYEVTVSEPIEGGYFVAVDTNIAGIVDTADELKYGTKIYVYLKKKCKKGFKFKQVKF